uniref:Uncharacterized protein n=1 Tax=Romanomermis culicivorax TaxID=13658 RepID=A0A915IMN1_ROMCU
MVKLEDKQALMKDEIQILKRRIEPLLIENGEIDIPALKERFRMYDRILKDNIDLKLKCNKLEARLMNLSF